MLIPIEEHELLVFWVQLLVIVFFARAFGSIMRRVGLPAVIGELGAGLFLGPSVFGVVWPEGFEWFLPTEHAEIQSAALLGVAWVGVALLLVVTGFETDLGLIQKLGKPAAIVTTGSLVVPMIGGLIVGYLLPSLFVGAGAERLIFALFVALALSVSSLAVVAKILSELGLMRRDFGQITVAAGMANDVVGWLLLGVFAGMAQSGGVDLAGIATTVGLLAVFVFLSMTVGQRLVDWSLRQVRSSRGGVHGALTVSVIFMLAFGVVTQWLGVEAVLGAFIAGVLLHRSRFQNEHTVEMIEGLTFAFFAPVFFATAGLRIDLRVLNDSDALLWTGVIILVAIVAKFIGAYAGGILSGRSQRGALALGAGLNARGALEIVIATVGAAVGVFNNVAFTAIVLVPVVTSVFASISLRLIVRNYDGSPDEIERLEREEALAKNVVVNTRRILLPSRANPASIAAAQVMQFAWPPEAGVTVLASGADAEAHDFEPLENVLWDRDLEIRTLPKVESPSDAILDESKLGFGVIGLGVDDRDDGTVVSPLADDVLSRADLPVVLIRRAQNVGGRGLPAAFSRALVPVAGTASSRAATEIAFSISRNLGTEVVLTHVVEDAEAGLSGLLPWQTESYEKKRAMGEAIIAKSTAMGHNLGVESSAVLRDGRSAPGEVVSLAHEVDADLVVLGATLRRVDDKPFLGRTVEGILENSDATVVIALVPVDL